MAYADWCENNFLKKYVKNRCVIIYFSNKMFTFAQTKGYMRKQLHRSLQFLQCRKGVLPSCCDVCSRPVSTTVYYLI